jgi:lipopolysaccharide/colanic/teichoic acid biosynthesis glycosyltransferase
MNLGLKRIIKRILDLAASIVLLILCAPLMALIYLRLRLSNTHPLFTQARPGLNGRIFTLYKFKTMTDACAPNGQLLPDAERLTPFGTFLRRTSLDELPQLWNVLIGNMSLVGPRPLLPEYLPRYSPTQARRHEVKPGITGWAQINGRNVAGWERKLELDVWYVDHWSLWLDIKILLLTARKVLMREQIALESIFMGEQKSEQAAERFPQTTNLSSGD